jgi:hypothetical protein
MAVAASKVPQPSNQEICTLTVKVNETVKVDEENQKQSYLE